MGCRGDPASACGRGEVGYRSDVLVVDQERDDRAPETGRVVLLPQPPVSARQHAADLWLLVLLHSQKARPVLGGHEPAFLLVQNEGPAICVPGLHQHLQFVVLCPGSVGISEVGVLAHPLSVHSTMVTPDEPRTEENQSIPLTRTCGAEPPAAARPLSRPPSPRAPSSPCAPDQVKGTAEFAWPDCWWIAGTSGELLRHEDRDLQLEYGEAVDYRVAMLSGTDLPQATPSAWVLAKSVHVDVDPVDEFTLELEYIAEQSEGGNTVREVHT